MDNYLHIRLHNSSSIAARCDCKLVFGHNMDGQDLPKLALHIRRPRCSYMVSYWLVLTLRVVKEPVLKCWDVNDSEDASTRQAT